MNKKLKNSSQVINRKNSSSSILKRCCSRISYRSFTSFIRRHFLNYVIVVIICFIIRKIQKSKFSIDDSSTNSEPQFDSENYASDLFEGSQADFEGILLDPNEENFEELYQEQREADDGSFFSEEDDVGETVDDEPKEEVETEDDDDFHEDPDIVEPPLTEEVVEETSMTSTQQTTTILKTITTTIEKSTDTTTTTSILSSAVNQNAPIIAIDPELMKAMGYKPPENIIQPVSSTTESTTTLSSTTISSSSTQSERIPTFEEAAAAENNHNNEEEEDSDPTTAPWIPMTKKGQNLHLPPCKKPDSENCPTPSFNVINPNGFYKTDPDKYLIPIVKWGPNNQILGFYEAMDLARQLNRTLVFTPMFSHATDKTAKQKFVDPDVRLNIDGISSFIRSVSWQEAHVKCNNGLINTVFLPQWMPPGGPPVERVKEFEDCTNFNIFNQTMLVNPKTHHVQFRKGVTTHPDNMLLYSLKQKLGIVKADDEVRKNISFIYNSDEKCAILAMPYKLLKPFKPNIIAKRFKAYDLPKYIEDMCMDFEQVLLDEMNVERDDIEYVFDVTIHWRYNKGDWSNRCMSTAKGGSATKEQTAARVAQCNLLKEVNATFVASCIKDWWELTESQSDAEINDRINVYMAAPISQKKFLTDLAEAFNNTRYKFYSSVDTEKYLNEKYPKSECCWFHRNYGEIVSLYEQALLVRSNGFLAWPSSSWSGRVGGLRTINGNAFAASITDLMELQIAGKLKRDPDEQF